MTEREQHLMVEIDHQRTPEGYAVWTDYGCTVCDEQRRFYPPPQMRTEVLVRGDENASHQFGSGIAPRDDGGDPRFYSCRTRWK